LHLRHFGTGYSSLSYLHRFSFDVLKINRSFISRIGPEGEQAELVWTIIALARNLGMAVSAEGVETTEQVNQLRMLTCDFGQGYLFARPLSASDATELIERSPQW